MSLAIIGAEGQFGRSLRAGFAGQEMLLLDLPQWDITSKETISFLVRWAPDVVIEVGSSTYTVIPSHAIVANAPPTKSGIRLRSWQEALVAYFQERSDGY